VENPRPNSNIQFDILCSFESFYAHDPAQRQLWIKDWNNYTFLLLREGSDPAELEGRFPEMVQNKLGRVIKVAGARIEFFLTPLTDIHLHSNLEGEMSSTGNMDYIYAFAAIAFFILLIACINFMNLATARSANRAKEVGMRKVLGANRRKLIIQFLGESLFLSFFAFILALAMSELALPLIRSLSGADMNLSFVRNPWLAASAIGFIVFVGILAGSYPAMYLASFKPIKVLQGRLRTGLASFHFRSVLVVVQFTISIVLIVGTFIIFKQINYMKNKKLGFHKEHVVVLQVMDNSILQSIEAFKVELQRHTGITNVAVSSHIPSHGAMHNAFVPEGFSFDESQMMGKWSVDQDLIPTLGMEIVEGRNFSKEFGTDMSNAVILNETAVKKIGWTNPIGKQISELQEGLVTKTVIGVVKDFHVLSLQRALEPVLFEYRPSDFAYVSIRLNPEKISETLRFLEAKWKEFDPTGTFDYAFLDEEFNLQYRSEERLNRIFTQFTMIAIFIACLGLFGLASFTAEQRTKEIGIRKVLGASESGIVILLSREFTKWVGAAMILAWPIAYFVMSRWLQDFAYRTQISVWSFLFSAVASLLISLLTVGFQAIKAARANPVKSLRYE
jgi:putative ABC transport system permease protein